MMEIGMLPGCSNPPVPVLDSGQFLAREGQQFVIEKPLDRVGGMQEVVEWCHYSRNVLAVFHRVERAFFCI